MKAAHAAGWAAVLTLIHAVLLLGWAAAMILYVPGRLRAFGGYDMTLPWLTAAMLDVSHWMVDYWVIEVPVLVLGLAADFAALFLLLRGPKPSRLGWIWSGFVTLVLLGIWVISVVALWLPLVKLEEGFSR